MLSQERLSRRDFNKAVLTLVGGGLAISIGCSARQREPAINNQETPIGENSQPPEIIMDNSDQIGILDVKANNLLTEDIGVNRIAFIRYKDIARVHIFTEFTDKMVPIPLGSRRADPSLKSTSAFVPFDPTYDLSKAADYAQRQAPAIDGIKLKDDERVFNTLQENNLFYGGLTYLELPDLDQDLMYYIAPKLGYLKTNDTISLSPATLLKAKIKFTGKLSPKSLN